MHRLQYLLAGFSLQAFLALAWAASIPSGDLFCWVDKSQVGYSSAVVVLGLATLVLSILFGANRNSIRLLANS